jgi:pimeloyl-ACP methyl ester carboxylesterase
MTTLAHRLTADGALPVRHVPIGRVIAVSLATGAALAAVLMLTILFDVPEPTIVGSSLIAFALGWGLLAEVTTRLTTSPQRWARLPAAVLAVAGVALLILRPGEQTLTQLAWLWAPALVVLGGYVAWQAARNVPGRAALLVHPVALLTVLAGLGGLYQISTPAPQDAAGAMPGRLVDVGGYRLHLDCGGSGSPTVILLNGLGETSPQWARISPELAPTTRVCAYDRAGQGWSDDSPNPADAAQSATDLHTLLHAAGEAGPFVLVGHSIGGIHALTYAAAYPTDVAGLVLLDSASPRQVELVTGFSGEYEFMRRALAVAPTLFRFGVGHVLRALAAFPAGTPEAQAATFANSPRGLRGARAEQGALPASFAQARALQTLGATPLVVLTARENVDQRSGWSTAQEELARLSSNVRHTIGDVSHVGLLTDSAGSALSVQAIDDVITSVRTRTPLVAR